MQRQIEVLIRKVELELTNSTKVGNINDAAYLDTKATQVVTGQTAQSSVAPSQPVAPKAALPIDRKYDWYQNASHVFLSFKVTSPEVAQQAQISFDTNQVHLSYNDIIISLELSNEIVPAESISTAASKKVELKLKKSIEGANWLKVEKDGEAKLLATGVV